MAFREAACGVFAMIIGGGLWWPGGVSASGKEPSVQPPAGFARGEDRLVTAELIAEHASVQPGGATRVGVRFDLEEGWHIYAQEPGDAGLPTKIAWSGPAGVSFGPLSWPTPERFDDPGNITTFGYSGTVVLASPLAVSPNVTDHQPLAIEAKVSWLACKELCIPGSATLALSLPVSTATPTFSAHNELFEHPD